MPKVPMYTLAWSPTAAVYELYETRSREVLQLVPESPAWFTWLERVSSFAFSGKSGHYTARKEAKQRGDRYWYAYLATAEQLTKKYLGKSADLTNESAAEDGGNSTLGMSHLARSDAQRNGSEERNTDC